LKNLVASIDGEGKKYFFFLVQLSLWMWSRLMWSLCGINHRRLNIEDRCKNWTTLA
jgi:hypothetical protein